MVGDAEITRFGATSGWPVARQNCRIDGAARHEATPSPTPHRVRHSQRSLPEKCSRPKERRLRLPVDPVPTLGRPASYELSTAGSYLRGARAVEASRQFVTDGCRDTMHMQKALSQMNLQIHHVLSDITGMSGLAILDAILAGERDPAELAKLCHVRVKSPRETVARALEGDYRPEHLFTLRQSLDGYRFHQKLISDLDCEIAEFMQTLPSAAENSVPPMTRTKRTAYRRQGNDPSFDLRGELYRIAGVDLTDIPGVSTVTAQVILTEVGPDVSRFRHASAFASWLGLCPEKRVSGGKFLSCRTRRVAHRAATALRLGAHTLTAPRAIWVSSSVVCDHNWVQPLPSQPLHTRSRALSITSCSRRKPPAPSRVGVESYSITLASCGAGLEGYRSHS